jgi:uncharacterized protein DUF6580
LEFNEVKPIATLNVCLFVLLVSFGVAGRWLGAHDGWAALPPNFTPIAAIGLFGGFFFASRTLAMVVPLAALVVSNLVLDPYGSWGMTLTVYASFLVAPMVGHALRTRPTAVMAAVGVVLPSVFFYLTTNLADWLIDVQHVHSMYTHTWDGLIACYAAGIPFFRWMLAGDLLFSTLLFGAYGLATSYSFSRPVRVVLPAKCALPRRIRFRDAAS